MNSELFITQLERLKLYGMAETFGDLVKLPVQMRPSLEIAMEKMLENELSHREDARAGRLIKAAKFRFNVHIEDVKCSVKRNFTHDQLEQLADCSFVREGETLILTGKTGCGKSFLACALGRQACLLGLSVMYISMNHFPETIQLAYAEGTFEKLAKKLSKIDLLIFDDFGLQKMTADMRQALFTIIEDRHHVKGTIINSQLAVAKWYDYLGEPTMADAIMDRILSPLQVIELKGDSLRPKERPKRIK